MSRAAAAPAEARPDVAFTPEGGGIVARCTACDWEVWKTEQHAAEKAAREDHKTCRAFDLGLVARRQKAQRLRSRAW